MDLNHWLKKFQKETNDIKISRDGKKKMSWFMISQHVHFHSRPTKISLKSIWRAERKETPFLAFRANVILLAQLKTEKSID